MDTRIHQVTEWYNNTLERHRRNKDEFNRRFAQDGEVDLKPPDVAVNYGRLQRETELLNALGSILQKDVSIVDVPDDISGIDEA